MRKNKFIIGQTIFLFIGSIIGWKEVISEINYYCNANGFGLGGLTSFSGTITTNPALTPCFWGSIAFVVATIWSIAILMQKSKNKQVEQMKKIFWLLLGSSIFALANTAYTFYKYYSGNEGSPNFGCPAERIVNPFTTACFMGATAFTLALITNILYKRSIKKKDENSTRKSNQKNSKESEE